MKFIDEAVISVSAGKGGAGSRSYRREKFVPMGGPDGGDGGRGGSVILVADSSTHTLLDFKFQPKWAAEDGENGSARNCTGKAGEDLIIKLPVGTQVLKEESNELVCDLAAEGMQFVLAKGGRGGKGNDFFKSPTNRSPDYAQPGEEGQAGAYLLSLKLVADVGLIGFPNAGKSTLISRISAAKPKIADYPFTTLTPNLGVVRAKSGKSFVVADIPGLIPGASDGKGLGIKFLKHVERTRVLAHLIDPVQVLEDGTTMDAMTAYDLINAELQAFSTEFSSRPQLVVITKTDLIHDESEIAAIKDRFVEKGIKVLTLSSATGKGIPEFIEEIAKYVF